MKKEDNINDDLSKKIDGLPSLGSTIKSFCLMKNFYRSKSLGQNFLINGTILKKIVSFAGDLQDSIVLEIGSGPGGLTREILRKNPIKLISIEKDNQCVECLGALQTAVGEKFSLFNQDILQFSLDYVRERFPEKKIKIIANLPYNIGTKILLNFLYDLEQIDSMTLVFQKEVADRIVSIPSKKEYGRLSVLSQYLTQPQKVYTIFPGSFIPSPKVLSSVVHFIPRKGVNKSILESLSMVTQAAFQARRKTIGNSLRGLWSEEALREVFFQTNLAPSLRPENLSVEDFVKLAAFL